MYAIDWSAWTAGLPDENPSPRDRLRSRARDIFEGAKPDAGDLPFTEGSARRRSCNGYGRERECVRVAREPVVVGQAA